jgi:hypothetical protein
MVTVSWFIRMEIGMRETGGGGRSKDLESNTIQMERYIRVSGLMI